MAWDDRFYDYDIPRDLKGFGAYRPGVEGGIQFKDEARVTDQDPEHNYRYQGRGPRNWVRSDERILDDICQSLTDAPDIDATDIEVSVRGGIATLNGVVPDRRMKRSTEDVAFEVPGVRDVKNQLSVVS